MMVRCKAIALVGALLLYAGSGAAQQFEGGIPAGWNCMGNCGTLGADGVVTLAPDGGTKYGYVSTLNGTWQGGLTGIGGTNGSVLRSSVFAANAADPLEFFFNYVTSDGSGYADYAWARLLNADLSEAAMLFTARTKPSGNIVPGQDMPLPSATLTPGSVEIKQGTNWSALGGSSGSCYSSGCGYSGWVFSSFVINTAGNYILEFGVTNWADGAYDSGLAFDGLKVGGVIIGPPTTVTPEPVSMALLGTGLAGVAAARRRKKQSSEA